MQSLQPDPAARYRNVLEALWRIIRTEGLWRPMRGLNVTATGAGPAHALYFACYEKLKKTLSDVIHPGGNSHIANGIEPSCAGPPLSQLSGLCCCLCFPVSAWFGAAALGWGRPDYREGLPKLMCSDSGLLQPHSSFGAPQQRSQYPPLPASLTFISLASASNAW